MASSPSPLREHRPSRSGRQWQGRQQQGPAEGDEKDPSQMMALQELVLEDACRWPYWRPLKAQWGLPVALQEIALGDTILEWQP